MLACSASEPGKSRTEPPAKTANRAPSRTHSTATRPTDSNLNLTAGETIPNLVVVKVGSGGQVDSYNGSAGTVQVVTDVSGWFGAD